MYFRSRIIRDCIRVTAEFVAAVLAVAESPLLSLIVSPVEPQPNEETNDAYA